MNDFIDEVIASGGTCRKDHMLQLFETEYEIERWKDYKSNWKTRRFKEIATGMGYQINPGRANERYQQLINGEMIDFFELVKPVQPAPTDPRQSSNSAPEQEAPKTARDYLRELVVGRKVTIRLITTDRYRRTVAELFVDGSNVQQQLVASGHASIYWRYADQCPWIL